MLNLEIRKSKYEETNNTTAFVAFINSNFNPLSNIEFDDHS